MTFLTAVFFNEQEKKERLGERGPPGVPGVKVRGAILQSSLIFPDD